ncbi:hypothetical protein OED52_00675 [Rhodococcus sp. Z13]|uniref:Uncharacterized protein n=1 Tax=Rhodococcus sacchari TaxID=2962047 RepID=A0ACD4DGI9_9NOCA|nr:hypothetical protein [Rhodococcus sp. Z13]UYP19146.1 hypothetical protein OED52_00675 [Rhodococcus sp. Z13]
MTTTTGYLRRTRRSLHRRDPLVRHADRIEARCFSLLLAVLVALVPVAVWLSATMWTSQLAISEQQHAERTTVTATLDETAASDATGWGETVQFASAPATWEWNKSQRHAVIKVDGMLPAGSDVQVWVDKDTGEYADPPLSTFAAKFTAVLAGVALWTFTATVLVSMFALVRWRLDSHRSREWSREIEAFLGSTSSH